MASQSLNGSMVAILLGCGSEQVEFTEPKKAAEAVWRRRLRRHPDPGRGDVLRPVDAGRGRRGPGCSTARSVRLTGGECGRRPESHGPFGRRSSHEAERTVALRPCV